MIKPPDQYVLPVILFQNLELYFVCNILAELQQTLLHGMTFRMDTCAPHDYLKASVRYEISKNGAPYLPKRHLNIYCNSLLGNRYSIGYLFISEAAHSYVTCPTMKISECCVLCNNPRWLLRNKLLIDSSHLSSLFLNEKLKIIQELLNLVQRSNPKRWAPFVPYIRISALFERHALKNMTGDDEPFSQGEAMYAEIRYGGYFQSQNKCGTPVSAHIFQ